jgi:hypothetical protein
LGKLPIVNKLMTGHQLWMEDFHQISEDNVWIGDTLCQ